MGRAEWSLSASSVPSLQGPVFRLLESIPIKCGVKKIFSFLHKSLYTTMGPQGSIEIHLQLIYYIKSSSLFPVYLYTYVCIVSLVSLVECSLVMKSA